MACWISCTDSDINRHGNDRTSWYPAISFTGGTNTGQKIARIAAPMFKLSLGLAERIRTSFSDYVWTIPPSPPPALPLQIRRDLPVRFARIFIERSIYADFREKFLQNVQKFTVGDPRARPATVGSAGVTGASRKSIELYSNGKDDLLTELHDTPKGAARMVGSSSRYGGLEPVSPSGSWLYESNQGKLIFGGLTRLDGTRLTHSLRQWNVGVGREGGFKTLILYRTGKCVCEDVRILWPYSTLFDVARCYKQCDLDEVDAALGGALL